MASGTCHLSPVVIDDDQLDGVTWRTSSDHLDAQRIESRERLRNRRVLAL
jgi:hypothetical protein